MPRSGRRISGLTDEVYDGLAGFRLAMRRFVSCSESALAEAGISSQQYQALLIVRIAPSWRVKLRDLAEQMLMHHNGAVQLVDRMCLAGLAERIPAEDDKRSVLMCLTAKGRALLESLAKIHVESMLANESLLAESVTLLRQIVELT